MQSSIENHIQQRKLFITTQLDFLVVYINSINEIEKQCFKKREDCIYNEIGY